jgi:hypothetical protein
MKELLFGMKEKKRSKDEAKNRAEESRSGAEESSQTNSMKESASSSTCEGDSSTQEVRYLCENLAGHIWFLLLHRVLARTHFTKPDSDPANQALDHDH